MSGHSKWANIKYRKAAVDAQKSKIFSKIIREIMVAAKQGGGNPETNPRLRNAMERAKRYNVPSDSVEKAIARGTGQGGVTYEDVIYEGYGVGGVALLVEATTDNKNRTTAELRRILSRNGGSLGEAGCVAWMFERKGIIVVDKDVVDEDRILEVALEAGAEDVRVEDDRYEVITQPSDLYRIREVMISAGITPHHSELTVIPKTTVKVEDKDAEKVLNLIEALEEHEDVQRVYSNFDISDEEMERVAAAMDRA